MFSSQDYKDVARVVPVKGGNVMVLKKVEFGEQLDLTFQEVGTGGEFRYREFDFKQSDQTQEQYVKSGKEFVARLTHLLGCYFKEDIREQSVNFRGSNFQELCQSIVPIAQKCVSTGMEIKLKLVLNNKGYVALPRYPVFASSELKPGVFTYNQYDKLEVTAPKPDVETSDTKEPTF